ncbi:MAG: tyrosine-type recombinase/integrase [Bacteroidetes bacterium]|nr:tyrosine-type recombinase/integrase [Bacteroidota bacterium]
MYLVLNNKSPNYQLIFFRYGKRTSISTGTSSKREAEKFLNSFNLQPKAEPTAEKVSIKLSSFASEYKNYVRNTHSEKYLTKAVIPSFVSLQKFLPDIPLVNISSRNIDQFISSVASKAKFAASLYHRTLKAAFNKAVVWNYLGENPFNKIKSPKVPKSFPAFISEAELIHILNKTEVKLFKDIFTTAFYTGMRLGELLNMKWNWIDFSQEVITIKNSDEFNTKNKHERIIPIHPKVNTILKNLFPIGKRQQNDFIFNRYECIKLNESYISKQFKKAVRSAKLNDEIHFHSLRHSFASALVQCGVSLYAIKELLGHENIKTTQIYSHLQKENLSHAVNSI